MKPLHLLILCLLPTAPVAAQESIGVQAGAGLSWVYSDYFGNAGNPKLRLNLGVSYDHFISANATLCTDLLYQQRGFSDRITLRGSGRVPLGKAIVEFRYQYAALPIKVGFQFGDHGFGFGKIGLVPAVLIRASRIGPDPDAGLVATSRDVSGEMQRFDLGGIVEAGGGVRLNAYSQCYAALVYQHSISSFEGSGYPARHFGCFLNLGFRYVLRTAKSREARPASR